MTIGRDQVPYTDADDTNAIAGLGIPAATDADVSAEFGALDDDDIATDSVAGTTVLHASLAKLFAFKVFVVAGADETTSHDYTATGLGTTSTILAVLAFKDQATIVAANDVSKYTAGANKVTGAANGDQSGFTLVILAYA
jgi:hypothetical protein